MNNPVLESLLRHGVNRHNATKLVADYPVETIEHYIRVLDWIVKQPSIEKPKSVAGYLVQSIRQGYDTPLGFQKSTRKMAQSRQLPKNTTLSRETVAQRRVAAYIKKLSDVKRKQLQQAAMVSAEKPMLEAYRRAEQEQEPLLIELYRRLILEQYVAYKMAKRNRK